MTGPATKAAVGVILATSSVVALADASSERLDIGPKQAAKPAVRWHSGKVHEIDREASEVLITHGYLPELDMPPMTMAFRVKDARVFERLKAGDKVRFQTDLVDGVITATRIERVR